LLLRYQFLYAVASAATTADDCFIRCLATIACHAALGRFALRADGVPAALGATFTTAVRMIDGVHRRAANVRAAAKPAAPTGLAPYDCIAIRVARLANRCPTCGGHAANFAARQRNLRP